MKLIKKLLVLDRSDLALALLLTAGFWLLGEGIGWFTVTTDASATRIIPIGLLVALFGGAFMMTFFAVNRFGFEFAWLLQFGMQRRRQLTAQLAVQLLHGAAVMALALLLGRMSRPLERLWCGDRLEPVPIWEKLPLGIIPAMVVIPPLLGLFAGGVYRRFGRRGGYVLYFGFILICVSTGRILDGAESLLSTGLGLPLAAAAAVLLAGMAALGARWLLILDN